MTTAAEIRRILGSYLAEAQRVVLRPSGLLVSDGGRDELAREIVALANRDGGRILLGVSEAGAFEGRLEVDHGEAGEVLRELLSSRITPPLEARLEHLSTPDGELLIIGVPRRSGPPHAFARVSPRGSVAGRAFLIRDGARTLPVSDGQLRWLFEVDSDPAVAESFPLVLHLPRDGVVPVDRLPQPRAAQRFAAVLAGIEADRAAALAADPATLESAFMEVAPFALLQELEGALREGAGGGEPATRELRLDDMPVPGGRAVLGAGGDGLRTLLERRGVNRFLLPAGSELQLDFLFHQRKARLLVEAPAFTLTLSVQPEASGEGLAWGGGSAADLRWVRLRVELSCSYAFPGREESFGAELTGPIDALVERLRVGWDGERLRRALAPGYLDRISAPGGAAADP